MPLCRSCQAPIVFMRTRRSPTRALMPVDANLKVENAVDADATLKFEELREQLGADVVVSHFATCTEPDKWRHK